MQTRRTGLTWATASWSASRPATSLAARSNPVDLARVDAAKLAGAVLEAIDDTFHYTRVGRLQANEAMHLLRALTMVDYHLSELRSHAIDDLAAALEVSDPDDR